eukprot:scaffold312469_cov31-Tisochrysis_lutea.AAC.3
MISPFAAAARTARGKVAGSSISPPTRSPGKAGSSIAQVLCEPHLLPSARTLGSGVDLFQPERGGGGGDRAAGQPNVSVCLLQRQPTPLVAWREGTRCREAEWHLALRRLQLVRKKEETRCSDAEEAGGLAAGAATRRGHDPSPEPAGAERETRGKVRGEDGRRERESFPSVRGARRQQRPSRRAGRASPASPSFAIKIPLLLIV